MQSPSISTPLRKHHKRASDPTLPGSTHSSRSSTLTPAGFLFVFVTLFLALGAINGQNNLLFWLFGFSIAALIVSGIITGSALIKLRITAHPLQQTELGSPLTPKYTLHNTSKLLPNFAIQIIELDAPGFSKSTPEASIPAVAIHIPPKSHTTTHSQIEPTQRGPLKLTRIRVRSRFPFGLFTKSIDFQVPRQTLILPKPLKLDPNQIDQLIASEDSTSRSTPRRGTGLDYISLRQYQPGDPLRTIAWKQSAKSNTLLVTEYPEPATEQLTLELATPSPDTNEELFERAISLTYTILRSAPPLSRTALSIPWAAVAIPSNAGHAHTSRIARALALLQRPESSVTLHPHAQPARSNRPIVIGYAPLQDPTQADLYASDFKSPAEGDQA
ncbi:MAG: DUF58 domain-containing protein [Phycisphaerales bacterium]